MRNFRLHLCFLDSFLRGLETNLDTPLKLQLTRRNQSPPIKGRDIDNTKSVQTSIHAAEKFKDPLVTLRLLVAYNLSFINSRQKEIQQRETAVPAGLVN